MNSCVQNTCVLSARYNILDLKIHLEPKMQQLCIAAVSAGGDTQKENESSSKVLRQLRRFCNSKCNFKKRFVFWDFLRKKIAVSLKYY